MSRDAQGDPAVVGMSATPTAADRAKAEELLTGNGIAGGYGPWDAYVRDVAQALADAREEGRRSVGDLLRTYVPGGAA